MFEKNLQDIKSSIKYYKRDPNTLIKYYINERLNKSLVTYFKTLSSSVYSLSVSDPEKVIKEI